jgi:hypothetical protein
MFERMRMVSLARSVVGLGSAPSVREAYLDLIAAGENDAARGGMSLMSGCGLTVRGLWRRIGMRDPRLEAPYEPASVMTTIIEMAKEADGWTAAQANRPPIALGDVVYVSAPDHVGTIVRVSERDDGALDVTTVDGGSTDAGGFQSIVEWDRTISADGALLSGPLAGNGRRIIGVASLPALCARFGGGAGLPGALLAGGALVAGLAAWRHFRRR